MITHDWLDYTVAVTFAPSAYRQTVFLKRLLDAREASVRLNDWVEIDGAILAQIFLHLC